MAHSLARQKGRYGRVEEEHLPPPLRAPLRVGEWVERVAGLETRLPVRILNGPPLEVQADGDQLDQLLINLIDNAVEAARETDGGVRVGWEVVRRHLEVWVEDDGPGISDTGNLFVPFYTTKPGASGIGLAPGRQIAEAHGGTLTLENRSSASGCIAHLRLPIP